MTLNEYIISSPRAHCPFCGKENIKSGHVITVHAGRSEKEYFQYCADCDARGPRSGSQVSSMILWDQWEEEDYLI